MVSTADLLAAPLEELLAEARRLRPGPLVTYSPKVFIPLTTLCRDVCGYCTFARPPRRGERAFMTEDEVLAIARAGAAAGCREALFTLGDKPELRYKVAREELRALGCGTTLEYLERCARLVLEETGLLPHLNPGVMTRSELEALRPVSASMGIMLETTAERLGEKGGPHWASPDKVPARRLETIRLAGELAIPFTSGILIGIGETREERIDALLALRALGEEHGHVQEVIVQNFRAKPGTRMAAHPEPSLDDHLWTIAVARILLGPTWHVQAPPNLAFDDFPRLLDAGIDDWGGVSPVTIDHVNPEAPWPEIERLARGDALAAGSSSLRGFRSTPSTSPISTAGSIPRSRRTCDEPPTRAASRATTPGRRASRATSRSSCARDALPLELDGRRPRRGRDHAAPRGARGRGRTRLRCRRPPASRGLRRRGQLRRDPEHPVHERLLLPLRLLRLLEGEARGEPARRAVSRPARGDRAAHRGGVGARRDRGLPPGRDPSGVHGRLLRGRRPGDQGRRARDPRARVLGARGLAGRGDARPLARASTSRGFATWVSARCRERLPRCSTTRCGGSSAPTR